MSYIFELITTVFKRGQRRYGLSLTKTTKMSNLGRGEHGVVVRKGLWLREIFRINIVYMKHRMSLNAVFRHIKGKRTVVIFVCNSETRCGENDESSVCTEIEG